jgi:DNA repair protein RecO
MHHIYHTEGIILSSRDFGETSRGYYIFTYDFGMIFASAQGVRKLSSRLRFILQNFAYIKIDLVQGKDFWRITSASKTGRLEGLLEPKILRAFINISRLLKRLLADEDKHEALFLDFLDGLFILEKAENSEEILNIETVIVLRVLNHLGYIGRDTTSQKFIRSPLEVSLVFQVSRDRIKILRQINTALKETHL